MAQRLFKLSKNVTWYEVSEKYIFPLRQNCRISGHHFHFVFAQSKLVFFSSRPILNLFFPFPDNGNYYIFIFWKRRSLKSFTHKWFLGGQMQAILILSKFRVQYRSLLKLLVQELYFPALFFINLVLHISC